MPDREKVIKAWECCNPFNRKCKECPYEKDCYHDGISRHMVANAISLLKEQEADMIALKNAYKELAEKGSVIVRCKDCKKRYTVLCIQEEAGNINNQDDWFCADGVAKDINVPNKEGR